ncbi:hypothetical protein [Desulfospira joergensenii]|nr:hypothetical protein [Desulfospira joergensenii]
MKKLYDSADLERKENRTPHYHFTWGGMIIPSVFAIVVLGVIFFLAK